MKRLNVSIEDNLHRLLKVAAAQQSTTISEFVTDAIKEKLEQDTDKKKEVAVTE